MAARFTPDSQDTYNNAANVARFTPDDSSSKNNQSDSSSNPVGNWLQSQGLPGWVTGNLLAGFSKGGEALHNLPYNVAGMIDKLSNVQNKSKIGELVDKIPAINPLQEILSLNNKATGGHLQDRMPQPDNTDFSHTFGVNDPGITGKILQGIGEYAPFGAAGELIEGPSALTNALSKIPKVEKYAAQMSQQLAPGAAFGAANDPENPGKGAVEGALTNVAGVPVAALGLKGVNLLSQGIKNALSKYAAKGSADEIGSFMKSAKDVSTEEAFNKAKENYEAKKFDEKSAWNNLTEEAKNADNKSSEIPVFNNKSHIDSLSEEIKKLQGESDRQSSYDRANKDSLSLLKGYKNDNHSNFTDAIEHNKALNQDYQNEITPGRDLPFKTVNFAKGSIKNTIAENIEKNGFQDTLGKEYENANNSTIENNKTFLEKPGVSAIPKPSTFSQLLKNEEADPSVFVNDYIPKGREKGTQKIDTFIKMVGDEPYAKDVLKQHIFSKAFDAKSNGFDPKQAIDAYNKLSDEQAARLFAKSQRKSFEQLNEVISRHPDVLSKPGQFRYFWTHSIPAIMGAIGGRMLGMGEVSGGLAGYTAGQGGSSLMKQAMKNPTLRNWALSGESNVNKNLAKRLTEYLGTAQLGNQ